MSVVYQNTLMTYQNFFLHWTGLPLAVIAVLIRIIDLPCYHKVFVQKERTWIISSSLIRIGIIPYYDSSLLGLRFTGFGLSFLDLMVNVECEKTASTTSILPMQVPEKVIQMACYDLRPFYSVPEVRGSNAFLPICSKMPYSDGWKLVCQQQLCWLTLTLAQRLLNGRLISVFAKREKRKRSLRTWGRIRCPWASPVWLKGNRIDWN